MKDKITEKEIKNRLRSLSTEISHLEGLLDKSEIEEENNIKDATSKIEEKVKGTYKKPKKGFVVSAVLYPLLILFLALLLGLLSMSDTRKRILDKMKLEIGDSLFDDGECTCETLSSKLDYILQHGVGGGGSGIPGSGLMIDINVKKYETISELPTQCQVNEIAIITDVDIPSYFLSATAPIKPADGTVWIVQDNTSEYKLTSDDMEIGISYAMQYINGTWEIKKGYMCGTSGWQLLYYIDPEDIQGSDIQTVYNYDYTGEYQEFRATFSGYYLVELWGAQGGTNHTAGGKGAYTYGTIYLNAGDGFYVYVGGNGSGATAGWNGGGAGGGSYGGGGGGATDIRLLKTSSTTLWNDFESLKSRIMIAAGGGGGSLNIGGASGGGLQGLDGGTWANSGQAGYAGIKATQSLGGFLNGSPTNVTAQGGFGYGGTDAGYSGAGGGGGYYGGGGGSTTNNGNSGGSGAGGSSYISGHEGCNSIDEVSLSNDITHTGLSYHYSGYYFTNTSMTAGENSGNGRAKITLKSIEVKTNEEIKEQQESTQTRWNFTYAGASASSGKVQTFTIPKDGQYKIEAWGAQGGSIHTAGGKGAYTSGTIFLNKGTILYIYVGSAGYGATAGWNGGGAGGGSYGGGGGGATDIRLIGVDQSTKWDDFESLASRIMVAAGGGGGSLNVGGGVGGTLNGNNGGNWNNNGQYGTAGLGAKQSLPGYLNGSPKNMTALGGFGYGGIDAGNSGAGGGGGYYGGGGGYASDNGNSGGSGGGGSSYISGYNRVNSIVGPQNVTGSATNYSTEYGIMHNGSKYHYSGYYFENTTMLSGNETMPSPTSTGTMVGNNNHGYVRITQLNSNKKDLQELKNEIYQKETIWDYPYTGSNHIDGNYQLFTAPKDGIYSVQLWGAQGGTNHTAGGKGAYTYGNIYLNAGEKYYVYVGSAGLGATAGWNGGGAGGGSYGGGGGGATDIRYTANTNMNLWKEFDSLKSRIMVAAGGGGGSQEVSGGIGGKLQGSNGTGWGNSNQTGYAGIAGTQTLAGYLSSDPNNTIGLAGFGYGGTNVGNSGAGGGGGYYGGGGGYSTNNGNSGGGGGGGSSYISGYEGCNSISENSILNEIIHTGSIYHFSDLFFTDARILAGNEEMPSYQTSSQMVGNSGDGYARIILVSETHQNRENLISDAKSNEKLWQYSYSGTTQVSGRYQVFTANESGYYKIDAWGAQGGTNHTAGGKGAYTSGRIYLTKNQKLYIYVGGRGYGATAGWNGGGSGGGNYGGGGGGATDIRLSATPLLNVWNDFGSLKSRIMIAAGGGGGSLNAGGGTGGALNGNNGGNWNNNGKYGYAGLGATQALPGYTTSYPTSGLSDFGIGGNDSGNSGGGGGGGYYGGGGGYTTDTGNSGAGGGGGSSYISGYEGCNSIEETSVADNIIHNGSAYHYSGYYFDNTSMLAGNEIMPSPNSSGTITGNSNDGYVKITLLNKNVKTLNDLKQDILDEEHKWYYTYSGNSHISGRYQVFNVPKSGTYSIELWGAQGGTNHTAGGLGAYTYGEIELVKNDKLYVYVGGSGFGATAGWNGGGNGGGSYGGGGGGATDIRLNPTTDINLWNETTPLKSRIMVAAGGGGGSLNVGGATAGGLTGNNGGVWNNSGQYGYNGTGGTQTSGGYLSNNATNLTALGGFGYGGSDSTNSGGAGGGGYYGGGGSYTTNTGNSGAGGGGGSSYISGHEGCIGIESNGTPKADTYSNLSDSISYTGYTFANTHMIDGAGYPWTTVKSGATSGMPNPTGILTQTGQSGNGYAIITYLGE